MSTVSTLQTVSDRLNAELNSVALSSKNNDVFEQGQTSGLIKAIEIIQAIAEENENE